MDSAKIIVQLLVLVSFSFLGWQLGHSRHKNTVTEDAITLPRIFAFLLGKANNDGIYNVKGVYTQIFAIVICIGFGAYIFGVLTLFWLSRIFLITLIVVFPILEIVRKVYLFIRSRQNTSK